MKRYITNNASYEALGELLMENPNGLLVESDEIIGLLKQLDASGQEVARSFYLTGADGDKGYTFDRIMRGKGLHVEAVCLSIIGGIQPGVLAGYVREATNGGAGADGLLQRFGLMVYPDISPDWKEVDRYPDSTLREAVNLLAERLDNLNPADVGAEVDRYGGVPFLRFDDAAQALFSEWRATLEHRLRSGEEHPAIVSHLSKYRKLIPSLALINHLCDTGRGAVDEAALLRAIALSEYLESHAQRIYSFATRPDIDAANTKEAHHYIADIAARNRGTIIAHLLHLLLPEISDGQDRENIGANVQTLDLAITEYCAAAGHTPEHRDKLLAVRRRMAPAYLLQNICAFRAWLYEVRQW